MFIIITNYFAGGFMDILTIGLELLELHIIAIYLIKTGHNVELEKAVKKLIYFN